MTHKINQKKKKLKTFNKKNDSQKSELQLKMLAEEILT